MRLFVALVLPAVVTDELAAVQQQLQRSGAHPVKWVAPAAIHLTVQFLGEVADTRVAALLTALEPLHATSTTLPIHLGLGAAGAFPHLRRPQTVWVGVEGDLEALNCLQQAVTTALMPFGFPPEERPFRAHLTLGRVRREATTAQRTALGTAIAALPHPNPITWTVGRPLLLQSTLMPGGAVYRVLGPG